MDFKIFIVFYFDSVEFLNSHSIIIFILDISLQIDPNTLHLLYGEIFNQGTLCN